MFIEYKLFSLGNKNEGKRIYPNVSKRKKYSTKRRIIALKCDTFVEKSLAFSTYNKNKAYVLTYN